MVSFDLHVLNLRCLQDYIQMNIFNWEVGMSLEFQKDWVGGHLNVEKIVQGEYVE